MSVKYVEIYNDQKKITTEHSNNLQHTLQKAKYREHGRHKTPRVKTGALEGQLFLIPSQPVFSLAPY